MAAFVADGRADVFILRRPAFLLPDKSEKAEYDKLCCSWTEAFSSNYPALSVLSNIVKCRLEEHASLTPLPHS